MGATYVTVTVRNTAEPERAWEGEFLADTGAFTSIVPRGRLDDIGVEPVGTRLVELADGSPTRLGVGLAILDFMGEEFIGAVLFGDDDAEPLLGLTTMQEVGVKVDPVNHRLERSRKLRF